MSRLTTKARKGLKSSQFAGPHRSFPIEDYGHAKAAIEDLPKAKNLTSSQRATIRRRAEAKLRGK